MRGVVVLAALAAAVLAIGTATGAARTASATVGVYPAGTTFTAGGAAPKHSAASVSLAMPIGGVDDAVILARNAKHVSAVAAIDPALSVQLLFAHYITSHGKPIPDVLEPWDGSLRATDHLNQPVWVQVTVPQGTAPGNYAGTVTLTTDGTPHVIQVSVDVANVTVPPPSQVSGSLLTAFNVSPQAYGAEVRKLYGVTADQSLPGFFSFLASYHISPNTWGYGNPSSPSGYTSGGSYTDDKSARMTEAVGNPRQFASMWIPISDNRSTAHEWAGGISPYQPDTWCPYLQSVQTFWQSHNWIPGAFPYLYGMDEPGPKLDAIVRKQTVAVHQCWPGSHYLVTSEPSAKNRYLWNGGSDDVDIWAVLESRYYGEYTNPRQYAHGERRATKFLGYINGARKNGAQIWTYTYQSPAHQTPGLAVTEPAADSRMFVEWAALEGITGLLRGQGMTNYAPHTDPLVTNNFDDGDFVLIYPGKNAPIASARLEELREGIEDWEILNIVRQKHGQKAVVKLLSHLFSTTATGAKVACVTGCPIKNNLPYSWPLWSKDATTATKIAQMRVNALQAAAS